MSSSSSGPPSSRPKWLVPVGAAVIVFVGIAAAMALAGGVGTTETSVAADRAQSTVATTPSSVAPSSTVPKTTPPVAALLGFAGNYVFSGENLEVLNTSGIWADPVTVIDIGDGVVSYENAEALRNGSFSFLVDGPGEVDSCDSETCVLTIPGAPLPLAISMTSDGQLTVLDFTTLQQRRTFCGFAVRAEEGTVEPTYASDGATVESFRYTTSFGSGSGGPDGCEDAIEVALTLVGTRVP